MNPKFKCFVCEEETENLYELLEHSHTHSWNEVKKSMFNKEDLI